MSFKHVKFEDSPVMRSLEKIAQQKGMVKPETLTKTAAKKTTDLVPTENLTVNILKLCSELRARGFVKQANEIETNLINYKKAQTLYETSPEKGEDLVEAAHPKGSHKLEDVDSEEAVFEDILDQMAKTVEVVNKKPTGKLSSTQSAIGEVRRVLAQGAQEAPNNSPDLNGVSTDKLESYINGNVEKASQIITNIGPIIKSEITFFTDYERKRDMILDASKSTTIDNLEEMISQIGALETRIRPHTWVTLGLGGITENTWSVVQPMINNAFRLVNGAMAARKTINARRGAAITNEVDSGLNDLTKDDTTKSPSTADQLIQNYKALVDNINRDIARVNARNIDNKSALVAWLTKARDSFVNKSLQEYSTSNYKDDKDLINSYTGKYNNLKSKIDAFEQKWLA